MGRRWRNPGTTSDSPGPTTRITYLLKLSPAEHVSYRASTLIGDLFGVPGPVTKEGQAMVYYPNHPRTESLPEQIDIEIDVAVGEWKVNEQGRTHWSISPQPTYPDATILPDGGIIVLSGLRPNPREESIKTLIEATTNPATLEVCLECTTAEGRRLNSQRNIDRFFNRQLQQYTSGFEVPIQEIQSIAVRYRLFHPVAFRNVSLCAGHETVVTVQTEASPDGINRPLTDSTVPPDEAGARLQSARRLDHLSKAMLIYANDHGDRLPEEVEDLREELKQDDLEWLLRNVTYLGKGLPTASNPSRVVAYDKTLLAWGHGTNVLYLDAHVVFEKPDELQKLDIPPAAGKDERVAVMNHLKQLALAMLLYAEDHGGTYAPSVQEAKPYLGEEGEFTWAVENIGYLGAGAQRTTVTSPATQPLAYWKTVPPTEDGTAVAFFDGHVEFVKRTRLAELGIR
jgi:prepilin-type processing-associated H-X9-DG protein